MTVVALPQQPDSQLTLRDMSFYSDQFLLCVLESSQTDTHTSRFYLAETAFQDYTYNNVHWQGLTPAPTRDIIKSFTENTPWSEVAHFRAARARLISRMRPATILANVKRRTGILIDEENRKVMVFFIEDNDAVATDSGDDEDEDELLPEDEDISMISA